MCSLQQHNNAAPGENEKMKEKAKKQTAVWMSVFFLQNAAGGGLSASTGRGAAGNGGRFFHRYRPCHGVSDTDEATRGARFL